MWIGWLGQEIPEEDQPLVREKLLVRRFGFDFGVYYVYTIRLGLETGWGAFFFLVGLSDQPD